MNNSGLQFKQGFLKTVNNEFIFTLVVQFAIILLIISFNELMLHYMNQIARGRRHVNKTNPFIYLNLKKSGKEKMH